MNENNDMPKWKKVLRWIAAALVAVVVVDWLLDGRLRRRLPYKSRRQTDENRS